jgi:hypothetical protein
LIINLEHYHPRITPEQAETIVAASDVFRLWVRCKRPVCRRRGQCCGFADAEIPTCVSRLLECTSTCLEAIAGLVPERRPETRSPADEVGEQIGRVQKRMAEMLENELEKMLGGLGEREGRENKLV